MRVIDRQKAEEAGLLGFYGSFGVVEQAESSLCCALHTQRIVSQTNHIHQWPTALALCPAKLLTSEATSGDMRPAEGGPEEGQRWWWRWLRGVGVRREAGRVRICHILALLSTRGLQSSPLPCRDVDSSSKSLHFQLFPVYGSGGPHTVLHVRHFNHFYWRQVGIINFPHMVEVLCKAKHRFANFTAKEKRTFSVIVRFVKPQ